MSNKARIREEAKKLNPIDDLMFRMYVSSLSHISTYFTAYNNKFPITSGSKRRYKETEEGQQTMCEIMDRIAREEREEGLKEGQVKGVARINRLNSILIDLGRFDDMKRAAKDQA